MTAPAVGQLDLLFADKAILLSHLSPPLRITTAYPATVNVTIRCRRGTVERKQVQCPTYPETKTKVVVNVTCDGKVTSMTAACPAPLPTCVFWNTTLRAWSRKGVTTRYNDQRSRCLIRAL